MGGWFTNFFEDLGIGDINDIGDNIGGIGSAFITGGPVGLGLYFMGNMAVSRGIIKDGSRSLVVSGLGSFFNVNVGGEKQSEFAKKVVPVMEKAEGLVERYNKHGLTGLWFN